MQLLQRWSRFTSIGYSCKMPCSGIAPVEQGIRKRLREWEIFGQEGKIQDDELQPVRTDDILFRSFLFEGLDCFVEIYISFSL